MIKVALAQLSQLMSLIFIRYLIYLNEVLLYKAILIDKDSYLLEVIRYVLLNSVRACIYKTAGQYPWSSYRMMIGKESVPEWLNIEWALSQFGTRILVAQKRFIKFIKDGVEEGQLWDSLRHQIYLGEKAFIESVHLKSEMDRNLSEVPRIQARNIGRPIDYYQTETRCRNDAIIEAYKSGDFTQKQLSEYFGLHYSSISKI